MDNIHEQLQRVSRENAVLRKELLRQTGCSEEDIEKLLRVGAPVVNCRMGAELRKRFAVENFRDAVLASGQSDN